MNQKRRVYQIEPITVNGVLVSTVIIDPHFEEKHSKSIDDQLILKLVNRLNGRQEAHQAQELTYSYFVTLIELGDKNYRLIWLQEADSIYIGIVNAFRDKRKK